MPVAVSLAVTLVVMISGAASAGFSAQDINGSNAYSAGSLLLDGQTPDGATCYTTGSGSGGTVVANAGACTGNPLPSSQLSSSGVATATTTVSSLGTTGASSGTFTASSCGEQAVADASSGGADTGLVYGGISFGTSFVSPIQSTFTSRGITLDGSTGSYVGTVSAFNNPQTLSIAAWVKTTTSSGGTIIGFTNQQGNGGSNYDRVLWVDNSGYVVFGVYTGSTQELITTAKVNNGSWHLVVATLSSSGMYLYLDNRSAVSNTSVTSAQNYSGWWHLGWSPHSGWPDAPTSDYLNGSVAEVAVFGTALSSSKVATLYNASSASSYASSIASFSPSAYWPLDDGGTTPYTGAVPALSASTTLQDATGNGNTATVQGGVTLGVTGPLDDTGISLSGASGTYVETATSYSNPSPVSELLWFKAPTSGAAGSLMGFTTTQTNGSPSSWDRQIWIDQTGHIVYGVYPGSVREVTSPATYTDGNWHFVVASVGPSGQQLWIDGTEVASDASVTGAQSYTGWWHLGFSNAGSGWTDGPSSDYWNGSLAQAAVVPSQLTPAEIATLSGAPSSTAFGGDVLALGPTAYWPLDDGSSVCGRVLADVQATVGSTVTCVSPAGSGACASTPPATGLLSLLAGGAMPVPTSSSLSLLIRMTLSSASPSGVLGLHLLVNLTISVTRSSWSASLTYAQANVEV